MSEAAVAAKPTKSSAPVAPSVPVKPVAQTLRQALPRKFKPSNLQEMGQDYSILTVTAPADWSFEDVLAPIAWANVFGLVARDALNTRRDKIGSLIEVRSEDHAYYAVLYIVQVLKDGLAVQCIGPSLDPKTGKACPVDVKTGLPWAGRDVDAKHRSAMTAN